jgi:uncharacterized protein YjaG (DUF416 family)
MKITDRVLIFSNNSFLDRIKRGLDFENLENTVKVINSTLRTQAELQKVEIARGINNNTNKELENVEDDFFKEIVDAQTKPNDEKENTKL